MSERWHEAAALTSKAGTALRMILPKNRSTPHQVRAGISGSCVRPKLGSAAHFLGRPARACRGAVPAVRIASHLLIPRGFRAGVAARRAGTSIANLSSAGRLPGERRCDPSFRSQPALAPLGMHLRPASWPGGARLRAAPIAMRAGRSERGEALRGRRRLGGDAKNLSQGRRAPRVPEKRRRLDRARGAVPVLTPQDRHGSVRARRADREEGPQGRLHPDHLRDADHHGAPDGLLRQARAERRGDQDRGLGGDPRQDAEQGIRRRAHALADAARDHARRRLDPDPLHDAGGREHQRAGDHARRSSTRSGAIRNPGRA